MGEEEIRGLSSGREGEKGEGEEKGKLILCFSLSLQAGASP